MVHSSSCSGRYIVVVVVVVEVDVVFRQIHTMKMMEVAKETKIRSVVMSESYNQNINDREMFISMCDDGVLYKNILTS